MPAHGPPKRGHFSAILAGFFNLVGDEDDIWSERFNWSCASPFSYKKNAIDLAVGGTCGGGGL